MNPLKFGFLSSLLLLIPTTAAQAFSLELSEPIGNEIFNTSRSVPGSGGSENFGTSVSVGDSVRFRVNKEGETTEFAQLEIVYSADNGVTNTTTNDHQVMIVQTENSQGFTDTGTLTILLSLNESGGSGEFTFNWYDALPGETSTTSKELEILYTTYDLDFRQEIFFDSSQAQSITLDGSTLLDSTIGSTTNIFDPSNSNSTINEPKNAAQILSQQSSSHVFSVGKTTGTGNALYMFEFRDPSNNITFTNPSTQNVPFEFSPGLGLLICSVFWGSVYLKRRINSIR